MKTQARYPWYDPICGMDLQPEQVVVTFIYIGQEYGFCSQECYDMFTRAPEYYITHLAHSPRGHYGHRCPQQRCGPVGKDK